VVEYQDKYVIGLTGNIGTGKSLVRTMIETLGAFTIDTDSLGHRVLLKEGVGYNACVREFGRCILDEDGNIVRSALASIVFKDPSALAKLERIVQPAVFTAVDYLVLNSKANIIVIESISILDSELKEKCDSIWVVESTRELQIARLMKSRGMNFDTAVMRIDAQPDQQMIIKQADLVIHNNGTIPDIFKQIKEGWEHLPAIVKPLPTPGLRVGDFVFRSASHGDIERLKGLLELEHPTLDINDWVYSHHFTLVLLKGTVLGLIVWQLENLLFIITDYIYIQQPLDPLIWRNLVKYLEYIAIKYQSEAIVFLFPLDQQMEYISVEAEKIPMAIWRDIAIKLRKEAMSIQYKQISNNLLLVNPPRQNLGTL
jgi:dephospho-CoA kinase